MCLKDVYGYRKNWSPVEKSKKVWRQDVEVKDLKDRCRRQSIAARNGWDSWALQRNNDAGEEMTIYLEEQGYTLTFAFCLQQEKGTPHASLDPTTSEEQLKYTLRSQSLGPSMPQHCNCTNQKDEPVNLHIISHSTLHYYTYYKNLKDKLVNLHVISHSTLHSQLEGGTC